MFRGARERPSHRTGTPIACVQNVAGLAGCFCRAPIKAHAAALMCT
jgi:hypothetical protein